MPTTVRFFVQRHGKHDGNLTEEGIQQVQEAAKKHLSGVHFDCAFSSEVPRARQTAEQALIAIGQEQLIKSIREEPGFGYAFAEDPRWPNENLLKQIADAEKAGRIVTVEFILNELRNPPCLKTAAGLLLTMHQRARWLAFTKQGPCINVLVGSHGTNVLATLQPKVTPWARNADIMYYEFKVERPGASQLIHSQYLPAEG
ncbi:MAG: phosphoglycerate mutase family protein [Candidatus Andersenbacteria bacterium]